MMWNTSELTWVHIQTFGMSDLFCQGIGAFLVNRTTETSCKLWQRASALELHFPIEIRELEKAISSRGVQAAVAPLESQVPLTLH